MIERVEVQIPRIPGVATVGGPHSIGELEIATESHHVGIADSVRLVQRCAGALQRRPVDHEMADLVACVELLEPRSVRALRGPHPGRPVADPSGRVREPGLQREVDERIRQVRREGVGEGPAKQFDNPRVDQRAKGGGSARGPVLIQFACGSDGELVIALSVAGR